MKLISFIVPCYNSEAYMEKCIESLLPGKDRVEILLIDDGSTDKTAAIADAYEAEYPGIVRAIHQENKGHGGAVNTGIAHADGLYLKVVDSDDWLDETTYPKVLDLLDSMSRNHEYVDMMICDFIYDKVGADHKKVMAYRHMFPVNRIFRWEDIHGHMKKGHYILMHSVIYRTRMLRKCSLVLPEHTFYVDNLFVYQPLPSVHKVYYMDEVLYHYFIGRDDQSVTDANMIKRIDQQLRVTERMIDICDLSQVKGKVRRDYMYNYLEIMMTISSVFLMKSRSAEADQKKNSLWEYLHSRQPKVYEKMRKGVLGFVCRQNNKIGKEVVMLGYQIVNKIYGFN